MKDMQPQGRSLLIGRRVQANINLLPDRQFAFRGGVWDRRLHPITDVNVAGPNSPRHVIVTRRHCVGFGFLRLSSAFIVSSALSYNRRKRCRSKLAASRDRNAAAFRVFGLFTSTCRSACFFESFNRHGHFAALQIIVVGSDITTLGCTLHRTLLDEGVTGKRLRFAYYDVALHR